jgi:hypothetical protein
MSRSGLAHFLAFISDFIELFDVYLTAFAVSFLLRASCLPWANAKAAPLGHALMIRDGTVWWECRLMWRT